MKFAKDSVEWGIFGAVWKFYQEFYEPAEGEPIDDFVSRMGQAYTEFLKPLKGKPQYGLAKNLLMATVNDITDRGDTKTKGTKA